MTNCRFSTDKNRVLTTGGADHAIFQWRFQGDGFANDDHDMADQYGKIADYLKIAQILLLLRTWQLGMTSRCTTVLLMVITLIIGMGDSNSEDSDSDLSDVDEIDSDLEAEKQKSYGRAVYKEDMKVLKSSVKNQLAPGEKRNRAPEDSLKLKFVHG